MPPNKPLEPASAAAALAAQGQRRWTNRSVPTGYRLVVRSPLDVVRAFIARAAEKAQMSFEGDLSQCDLARLDGVSVEATDTLPRTTTFPRLDYAVVPLTPSNRAQLVRSELPRMGLRRRVIHLQIVDAGVLWFGAYDNFHPECVVCDESVPLDLLQLLQRDGHLRSFSRIEWSSN